VKLLRLRQKIKKSPAQRCTHVSASTSQPEAGLASRCAKEKRRPTCASTPPSTMEPAAEDAAVCPRECAAYAEMRVSKTPTPHRSQPLYCAAVLAKARPGGPVRSPSTFTCRTGSADDLVLLLGLLYELSAVRFMVLKAHLRKLLGRMARRLSRRVHCVCCRCCCVRLLSAA